MEPLFVIKNIGQRFSDLAKISTWHADRARRIFDSGCPKERVRQICEEENYFMREQILDEEEKKLFLPSMKQSIYEQPVSDYKKMEYEVAHQARVIQRMKEREEWFQTRISQLEKFCTTVATELSEMKKKNRELPEAVPDSADGRPPPLNLGSHSVPHHEFAANVCRKSVLEEEDLVPGMTPTLPLLPIPTHSLQKQVSWNEIQASAFSQEVSVPEAENHTCCDSEYFVYSQEGVAMQPNSEN